MATEVSLKFKITVVVFSALVLLQPAYGFSMSFDCGIALRELTFTEASILNPQSIDQKIQNLSELKLNLDLAKVDGTSSIVLGAIAANYKNKERSLVDYLAEHKIMTRAQLIERMKQQIAKLQGQNSIDREIRDRDLEEESRQREEQARMMKESVIDGTRAVFHRIEPDTFMMGERANKKKVTLTKPFDMMATPTTQLLYQKIADLANATFPETDQIFATPSYFRGNPLRPVESISFETIQIWVRKLNALSRVGESSLVDLIPGHKKGDVYRLPTEAEWEFVVRGRGELNNDFHFGNDEAELKDYAWYIENSDHTTHPVAQKRPLRIEGKEFYDMHGNVKEWVINSYGKLVGGIDPQGSRPLDAIGVVRGGGWSSMWGVLGSGYRDFYRNDKVSNDLGFRLVRVVQVEGEAVSQPPNNASAAKSISQPPNNVSATKSIQNIFSNIKKMFHGTSAQ